jgi:low affinity Fe/Cu permease
MLPSEIFLRWFGTHSKAIHLKLDEMIRALKGARNQLVDLEHLSDEELQKFEEQFRRLRKKAEGDGIRSRETESAKSR